MKSLWILAVGVAFFGAIAAAQTTNTPVAGNPSSSRLQQRADEAIKLFCAAPAGFESSYSPEFLKAVPPDHLAAVGQQLYGAAGTCTRAVLVKDKGPYAGSFRLEFSKGFAANSELVIEPDEPHRITGFLITSLTPMLATFDALIADMKRLPGQASLAVARIGPDGLHLIASLQPDTELALGSAFKLYVLAELVREIDAGERKWDDIVKLEEGSRSLPSGALHEWPVGSPLTLHTLAALMISQSDNTAADQLIHTLGREKIEAMLPVAGMKNPARNIPFLTTLELFRLKGSALGADYEKLSTVADRRAFLSGQVQALPREQISIPAHPTEINTIEWFASTSDLCRVMAWLAQATGKPATAPARDILAINPGLALDHAAWPYIGYKGGSEMGVLNMTYLLIDAKGNEFAVAATWNNPAASVDETKLGGFVQRAIELLAKSGEGNAPPHQ
jgi:beta-lactamase class A